MKKIEEIKQTKGESMKEQKFFRLKMGNDDMEAPSVFEHDVKGAEQLGHFFLDNMELSETWEVKCIKGTKTDDPTGNYEYTVKES